MGGSGSSAGNNRKAAQIAACCLFFLSMIPGCVLPVSAQQGPEIQLQYPWAGGMNSCQFGAVDINLDGKPDLVIFDRFGNRILPFINEGQAGEIRYSWHPEFASLFPDLHDWVIFADYNCDGKQDIFTYSLGGIRVFKNVSDTSLKFELITNLLTSYYYTGKVGILLTPVDYPAIADIDRDGDLDLLTFFGLGSYVEYHKNFSVEKYGNCDSLDYRLSDKCWGDFKESEGGNKITLNIQCPYKYSGMAELSCRTLPPKHTGSTLLATDLDGNGLSDLVVGDVDFPNLVDLLNGGTVDSAHMVSQDSAFPGNPFPVKLFSFPSCSFLDLDNDGIRDLVVSPFDPSLYVSENKRSCWFYKNTGTNVNPVFQFRTDHFFQNEMIDIGTSAYPVVTDVNGDGLSDLLIGGYGEYDSSYYYQGTLKSTFISKISYYKNTGQQDNPVFHLITDDFAGLSRLKGVAFYPSFADLDGDGDQDMITGNANGSITYFQNTAGAGNEPVFGPAQTNYQNIKAGSFSTPQLFDLDGDGLTDLVTGNQKGTLHYYRNTGTPGSPVFTHVTDSLGKVSVTNPLISYDGFSTPFFFKDPSGKTALAVGCEEGKVHFYINIDGNLDGVFTRADSPSFGYRSAATLAPLQAPGFMDLIVGNFSGGLNYFSHKADPAVYSSTEEKGLSPVHPFLVYPNPASETVFIRSLQNPVSGNFRALLYNSLGQPVFQTVFSAANPVSISVAGLPESVYFLIISPLSHSSSVNPFTTKIIVIR
ncbi:MAG: FG-GAP-like repeat-containing protein [Bacteroidetes bacterium]|nr:FG-GAP-like repeat-containing protein [Bacteroidota bacterium]